MEKIVYSKFSNERDPRFNIKTDILINNAGEKIVRKSACQDSAKEHVENIENYYQVLTEKFKSSKFRPNHCVKKDDCVEFEFIEAKTLEDQFDLCFEQHRDPEIFGEIQTYVDEIKKVYADEIFKPSEEFYQVFGQVELPDGLSASTYMNVDMIFQNIMVKDDLWHVIDYEWTYPFLIPTNFLVYRALFYYAYQIKARKILNESNIFLLFGMTQEEIACYEAMEKNFQLYIRGEYAPISMMHIFIGRPSVSIEDVDKEAAKRERQFELQAYFDFGLGFHQQSMMEFPLLPKADGTVSLELDLNLCREKLGQAEYEPVIGLRLDPLAEPGVLKILKIAGFDGRIWRLLHYTTNGVDLASDLTLYGHTDPQIIVTDDLRETKIIQIEYAIELPRKDILLQLSNVIARQEENEKRLLEENQRANEELNHLRHTVASSTNEAAFWSSEYAKVSRSLSWKLTKPIRKVTTKTKSLLQKAGAGIVHVTFEIPREIIWEKNPELYRAHLLKERIAEVGEVQAKKEFLSEEIDKDMEGIREFFWKNRDVEAESRTEFVHEVKFSILVPVYNTPKKFLHQMIGTVLAQSYQNWELCLADGSDKEHAYVGEICRWIAKLDPRVKYMRLKKNGGISENTNECLKMATGDYIGLYDHDDILHTSALYEYAYVIQNTNADFIYSDETTFHFKPEDAFTPHYKPDYAPDTLRTNNYICHFTVVKKELMDKVGGFRKEFDGSQDYDLILRLTEQAKKIVHKAEILYYWRAHAASTAQDVSSKPYTILAAHRALEEHLKRVGLAGTVEDTEIPSYYHIKYDIIGNPLVSILIPNKDHIEDLKKCLTSIFEKSTYKNIEIVIIENNSENEETFAYYEELKKDSRVKVVVWEGDFNYAAINNFGYKQATGDYILFLNNDVEVIAPEWIEEMLMFVQRKDVGAAGAKLYYPDDTIQHAGLLLGVLTLAGHAHKNFPKEHPGYMARLIIAQNMTGVTAACLLTKREVLDKVQGFDERFAVAFNDVDLCMKIRKENYLIVFAPDSQLYHYESKSRGLDDTPEKQERFESEIHLFHQKWGQHIQIGDPYYNPHFSLETEDFTILKD